MTVQSIQRAYTQLTAWLFDEALPLWSTVGTDPKGGFFEKLTPDGTPTSDPRRARLVARQIYCFAIAHRLGWDGPALERMEHGLDFLLRHLIGPAGTAYCAVNPDGTLADGRTELYDQAFVLFALAAAAPLSPRREQIFDTALRLRGVLDTQWRHNARGFVAEHPKKLPMRSNPLMHLLEACLAWEAISDDKKWREISDELARLCLSNLRSGETGAIHEIFDDRWQRLAQDKGDVIEPGHQFEWAWLLLHWGLSRSQPEAIETSHALTELAETRGVSRLGLAINELNNDLTPRDGLHRLWPQTERIKANVLLASTSDDAAIFKKSNVRAVQAMTGLLRYFEHPVRGTWWEHLGPDGTPLAEPSRASSLYHVICAIHEVDSAIRRSV